eukprot:scaffold33690_cov64-Phaeocystis_antarctica.AAC.5
MLNGGRWKAGRVLGGGLALPTIAHVSIRLLPILEHAAARKIAVQDRLDLAVVVLARGGRPEQRNQAGFVGGVEAGDVGMDHGPVSEAVGQGLRFVGGRVHLVRRLDGALIHRDEHVRLNVRLNVGLGGRGHARGEVVVQDRERLLHLDARDRVAIVHVGVEGGSHRIGVRRRRVLARAVRRRVRARNRHLRANRRVTRVPGGHELRLVGGGDALGDRDRARDARYLRARRGVEERRREAGRLGRGNGHLREHLAAVCVTCEEDAVVVRCARARLRTIPSARVRSVHCRLARFAYAATSHSTQCSEDAWCCVAQPSARHRVGGGAASPVCVVTLESRPRRVFGEAFAVKKAVVDPDDRCKGCLGRGWVALEARIRRGEAASINALAIGEAFVVGDRGVLELATVSAGQTGRDYVGDRDLHRKHGIVTCVALFGSVSRLVLQIGGGDSAHSEGIAGGVANGDRPSRSHVHVVRVIPRGTAHDGAPQSNSIGRLELAHDHVPVRGFDGVICIKRVRVVVGVHSPHEFGVGDDPLGSPQVLGPHALAVGLVELDQEAAELASHGARGRRRRSCVRHNRGPRAFAHDVKEVALDEGAFRSPRRAAPDIGNPLGDGAVSGGHIELGNDGAYFLAVIAGVASHVQLLAGGRHLGVAEGSNVAEVLLPHHSAGVAIELDEIGSLCLVDIGESEHMARGGRCNPASPDLHVGVWRDGPGGTWGGSRHVDLGHPQVVVIVGVVAVHQLDVATGLGVGEGELAIVHTLHENIGADGGKSLGPSTDSSRKIGGVDADRLALLAELVDEHIPAIPGVGRVDVGATRDAAGNVMGAIGSDVRVSLVGSVGACVVVVVAVAVRGGVGEGTRPATRSRAN